MTVEQIRAHVREVRGVWLTPQQVRWWARRLSPDAARRVGGYWDVDPEPIIDALDRGRLTRGDPATTREGALCRAVAAVNGRELTETRARLLLEVADTAPRVIRTGRRGAPRDGRVDSLAANLQAECGVVMSRERLAEFFIDS